MMTNLMTILERKAFISSNPRIVLSSCPPPCGHFSIQESATGGLSYKGTKGRTPKSSARNKKYSHAYLQINTHNCISLISINLQTLLTRQAVLLKYLLPYCFLTNQLCYNLFRSIQIFHLYTLQL